MKKLIFSAIVTIGLSFQGAVLADNLNASTDLINAIAEGDMAKVKSALTGEPDLRLLATAVSQARDVTDQKILRLILMAALQSPEPWAEPVLEPGETRSIRFVTRNRVIRLLAKEGIQSTPEALADKAARAQVMEKLLAMN